MSGVVQQNAASFFPDKTGDNHRIKDNPGGAVLSLARYVFLTCPPLFAAQ
jgi:hypothetical protein